MCAQNLSLTGWFMHTMHAIDAHQLNNLPTRVLRFIMDTVDQQDVIFRQLDQYPWDSDEVFQGGLQAILGPNPPPDQAEYLTIRAQCFYYARYRLSPECRA